MGGGTACREVAPLDPPLRDTDVIIKQLQREPHAYWPQSDVRFV